MEESIPAWAQEIRERVVRIETKLDQSNDVSSVAYTARATAQDCRRDIDRIEGSLTWLWRTVGGGFIVGAIGYLFSVLRGGK